MKNQYYIQNPSLFTQLTKLVNLSSKWSKTIKTENYRNLIEWIDLCVPLLCSDSFSIQTKVYWILNDIHEFPHCENKHCNKIFDDRNVYSVSKGYPTFCSHRCAVNAEQIKEKTKQTCLKKYGVSSPGQAESVKQKSKQTCLKKYGVEFSFQSETLRTKSKATSLTKYGVEHPMQSPEITAKVEQTKFNRYGEQQPWHYSSAYEKRKDTWTKKYAVDHPMKTSEVKEKVQQICLARHGVRTCLIRPNVIEQRLRLLFKRCIEENEYDIPLFTFEEFIASNHGTTLLRFKCKKCGRIFQSSHVNGQHSRCKTCFPVNHLTSKAENDIKAFIQSFGIDIIGNIRDVIGSELDVFIPSKHIAFEYDGLYWHNSEMHPRQYHLTKTKQCEEQNIQLVHIFENEWAFKQDIVKSRIKNLLGIHDHTIYARKCQLSYVDTDAKSFFLDENHLQGDINSHVTVGLFYDDELVSVMTFGKTRFSKKYEWEMLRFCSKLNYHVVGAAGKLLSYFEKTYRPKSLVSYADRRWSQGKVYKALGFTLDHISAPNYWYFKSNSLILESRVKFQKHRQKKLLENFDPSKTEVENMKANKYFRIFDCGNLVFTKIY